MNQEDKPTSQTSGKDQAGMVEVDMARAELVLLDMIFPGRVPVPDTYPHPDLPDFLTVGQLRQRLENLPDETPVYYERIEDYYFLPGKGWLENQKLLHNYDWPEEPSQYIRAYGAFPRDGGFYVTAHY